MAFVVMAMLDILPASPVVFVATSDGKKTVRVWAARTHHLEIITTDENGNLQIITWIITITVW